MPTTKRSKKFIDSTVQAALVKRIVIHWCLFAVTSTIVAFMMQYLSDPSLSPTVHLRELWWTHGFILVTMLALLPVFAVDAIKLSHRFAGPVHRLKKTIQGLAAGGPFEPVSFRGADYWQSLADDFNSMVEKLQRPSSGSNT